MPSNTDRDIALESVSNVEYFIDMIEREMRTASTDFEAMREYINQLHDEIDTLEDDNDNYQVEIEELSETLEETKIELFDAKEELSNVLVNPS